MSDLPLEASFRAEDATRELDVVIPRLAPGLLVYVRSGLELVPADLSVGDALEHEIRLGHPAAAFAATRLVIREIPDVEG